MLFGSPVPTHTTSEFDGATATAPTEPVRTESNTGAHVTPAFDVFQTPPVAVAAYITLPIRPRGDRALSVTARSEMRPLITAGPIERKTSDRTRTESGGSVLSADADEELDAPRAGP